MSHAAQLLRLAHEREARREAARVPIDYKAAQREFTQQKSALTRAINSKDPEKVILACSNAVKAWNKPGRSWPDEWSRWQRALDDILPYGQSVQLEDLG